MVAALEAQLGEGIVVRSGDVDENDVTGVVGHGDAEYRFAATFTDDGTVISCVVDPVG